MADDSETRQAVAAAWRVASANVVARVARLVGDISVAEELAQDTFEAALRRWPKNGVPDNPTAWLMATAKFVAVDHLRRRDQLAVKHEQLGPPPEHVDVDFDSNLDVDLGDELLGLMFMACHPTLSSDARVALTLRLLGGLTTTEIAHAFLLPEPTVAQRIVRAKRSLATDEVQFEIPDETERNARLESVLEVIYLIFNEGYVASAGDRWLRADLTEEAMRLGRIVTSIAPTNPEVHGLVALMALQTSRQRARTGPDGASILLDVQNRKLWNQRLIREGLATLRRAQRLGGERGPYALQAAIAACHATAPTAADTNWNQIAEHYDALSLVAPSPVVEVNRAVAFGRAFGPAVGLELADQLIDVPVLQYYHLLYGVRGDLLSQLGRHQEAHDAFTRSAALTSNTKEQVVLRARANAEAAALRAR